MKQNKKREKPKPKKNVILNQKNGKGKPKQKKPSKKKVMRRKSIVSKCVKK